MEKGMCSFIVLLACYVHGLGAENYVAEGYFVVDAKALNLYINRILGNESYASKTTRAIADITDDIGYLLTESNKLLETLRVHGLNLTVTIRQIDFLTSDPFTSDDLETGNQIDGGTAMNLFSYWLEDNYLQMDLNYDFALLWTGYDILDETGRGAQGLANIGKICDPLDAVSVVEFDSTYLTAFVTAHEIGHLLGASHDGVASDKVMTAANSPEHKHRWYFAECAATDIKEFLPLLTPNCLLETNQASTIPSTSWASYQGSLLDHNVICKRAVNDTRSNVCLSRGFYNNTIPKGDVICQQLYCQLPGTITCKATFTSEGIICDDMKRCDKGKCESYTGAPSANVDPDCVLGDQQALNTPSLSYTVTCQEFTAQDGRIICYISDVLDLCCATCKTFKTTIIGCEYGDKNERCATLPMSTSCATVNSAVCCYTCRSYNIGKRSTDEDRNVTIIKDESDNEVIKAALVQFKFTEVTKVAPLE